MRSQILIFGLLLLVSCKEQDLNRDYPVVMTSPVSGITSEGATFTAEFSNSGSSKISGHGFVWNTGHATLSLGDDRCHSVELGVPGSSRFQHNERSSLVKDAVYYVRGYVKTNGTVVYGTMVSFKSNGSTGPTFTDFSPKSGNQGDLITIVGNNFGDEINKVTITFAADGNEIKVPPINVSNTSIKVPFPATMYARTSQISIRVSGVDASAVAPFILNTPEIESLASTTLSACDSLAIHWIDHGFTVTAVELDGVGFPFALSGSLVKIKVKDATPSLSIKILSGSFYDIKSFTISPVGKQIISSFPSSIKSGDTLKIKFNFNTNCHSFRANSMGFDLTEVGRTGNEVWYVPGQVIPSPVQISIFIDNTFLAQSSSMTIQYPGWTRKQDFPGPKRSGAVGFSINGKGYLALGEDSGGLKDDLWEYDPTIDQWTQKAQFPGAARLGASAFVVNGKAYVGTGQTHDYGSAFKDFWQYDPVANAWTQKGDYPGGPRYEGCATFSIGTKGYMGAGQYSTISNVKSTDFWEYEPSNDSWTSKAPIQETHATLSCFSMNSNGYCFVAYSNTAARLHYDPVANTWDFNASYQPSMGLPYYYPFAFQNEVYFISANGQNSNKVFRVDPVTNTWTFVQYHGGTYYDFHFVVNGKAFTGATTNQWIYEFDPSQL